MGLNINEKVILKMSDERNYGYWLDTNMQLEDFMKQTGCQMVSQEQLEDLWLSVCYNKEIEYKN